MIQDQVINKLEKTLHAAVQAAIHELQPNLDKPVNEVTGKAMDVTQDVAKKVIRVAKENPWYLLVGATAALLLAGAIVSMGAKPRVS